ncbi:hypothetical protein LTR17_007094 [Elasticomyces elasticus]|nr:hypothetical protein LTR17_007094 [Elasticomyces elasticus]
MLQWLRQIADRRRDKSTVSTNVPPLTNIHNSHNRLLSLPDELLENVVSNLFYKIDLICLRQASRRMYYFLPVDRRECDLKHSERWDYRIALRRQAFLLASQAEAAGEVAKKKWPCHTCSDLHPTGKSTAWQQVKHITGRSCMLSQRRLEICEHHSFAVPQIMKIYENDMRHMYDRLKDWTVQGKVKQKGHHALLSEHQQCRHSIQIPVADCEVPSVRSLSITMRSPEEGGPAAIVCAQFKLDTFMRLTVLASELPAIPEPMIAEYVSKIRELLSLIAVKLCSHTSTADRHVLDRFDENLTHISMDRHNIMARHKGPRQLPGPKKPPLTHFLCLPLVTADSRQQLESSINQFRDEVVDGQADADGDEDTSKVHPKAIRPVGALHCTLGVMSLDKAGLEEAVQALQSLDMKSMLQQARSQLPTPTMKNSEVAIEPGTLGTNLSSLTRPVSPPLTGREVAPLSIDLKGLVSMHDPQNTSILYSAPEDRSNRLYPFCQAVQKHFSDAELLVPDDRPLKLHATIINTIYAKGKKKPPMRQRDREEAAEQDEAGEGAGGAEDDRSQGHGPKAKAPLKLDATALLERYGEFVWAENVVLDRIAICEMGAKKIMDAEGRVLNEEYTEVASVQLPGGRT